MIQQFSGDAMNFLRGLPGLRRKTAPRELVTTLVAISDPMTRRTLKQEVSQVIGSKFIEADDKPSFHRAVTFEEIDLIIVDAELNGCQSFDIIEQIRFGRLHCHAFPIVIMLCDQLDPLCAQRVSDCGADIVLNAAYAPQTIRDHVRRLTEKRKPFTAAPHYIGPDRRSHYRDGESSADLLVVPNPLAARVNALDESDYRREIAIATQSLSLRRSGLYALRMTHPALIAEGRPTASDSD